MKTLTALGTFAVLALLAAPSDALAQGRRATPTPTPAPTATPGFSPWTDPNAGSAPTTAAPAAATETTTTDAASSSFTAPPPGDPPTYRPVQKSIAIGAGYTLGGSSTGELLFNPNTVSARYRMASGLAIEPIAGIEITSDSSKVDSAKTTSSTTDIFAGANLRKPFWSRSQADFVLLVGADLGISSSSAKDADGNKTTSSGFGLGAGYGVGVEFWPRAHWSISFDATNTVLAFSSSSGKAGDVKTSATSTTIAPKFDPTIRLMTHLYY